MKTKLTIFAICILLSTNMLAQEKNPMYYGFDATFSGIGSTSFSRNIPLRNSYDSYSTTSVYTFGKRFQVGGKFIFFSKNEKIGFETGLRYALHRKSLEATGSKYLYLQNTTNTNSVDYYRIRKVTQNTGYVGVPLEFIWTPSRKDNYARFYFKVGFEFNLRLHNSSHIKAFDSQFDNELKDVGKTFQKPDLFYVASYMGLGMQFGKPGDPKFSLQLLFPYFTNIKKSGIIKTEDVLGITFEYKLPVKK